MMIVFFRYRVEHLNTKNNLFLDEMKGISFERSFFLSIILNLKKQLSQYQWRTIPWKKCKNKKQLNRNILMRGYEDCRKKMRKTMLLIECDLPFLIPFSRCFINI